MKIKNVQCDICEHKFYDKGKLKVHRLIHSGIKFNCFVPGCPSSVSRKDSLLFHVKRKHRLSPIEMQDYTNKLDAYFEGVKNKYLKQLSRKQVN